MMNAGAKIVAGIGLAGAAALAVWYAFTRRKDSGVSSAWIDAFRFTDDEAEADPITVTAPDFVAPSVPHILAPLEEVAVTAKKIASTAVDPDSFVRNTRGLRNKNPGNIRWIAKASSRWRGMIANDGTDYGVFDTDANGIRAIGKQLGVYQSRYGLRTIRAIITRWVPPSENATSAYISAVAKRLNVSPDADFDVQARLVELTNAIIYHENGRNPYAPADVSKWVRLP